METYPKIQTLFKRDMDGSLTGKKGKMIRGAWTTQTLEYLAGNEWEFTEKVDGTNVRVGVDKGEVIFAGRSDQAVFTRDLNDYLKSTFDWATFRETFSEVDLSDVVLFGEGYGPKIQNGGNYREDISFVLFDVKIGDWWLLRKDVDDIAAKLGIDSVPTLGFGTLHDAIDIVSTGLTFNATGAPVRWGGGTLGNGYLRSHWGNFEAEGIVARPLVPLFDRKGQRIITKIKAVDFR